MADLVNTSMTARGKEPRARHIVNFMSQNPIASVGFLAAVAIVALALAGPSLAPYSPLDFIDAPFQPSSATTLLGTDVLGRDALSRVLCGGYEILGLSAAAAVLGVLLGGLIGIFAGYKGGLADEIAMRLMDVAMAFPQIILVLLFVSIVGPNPWLIMLMVAANHAPSVARVTRAATLRISREDYIRFVEAIGMKPWLIILRELLPNVSGILLVEVGLRFTYSIAIIAGLGFLGFGAQPPSPDWGLLINENRLGMASNPWPVFMPVLLIAILTIGTNLFTDAIGRWFTGRGMGA